MLRVVGLGEVLITMVITLGVMPGDSLRRARRGLHGGLEVGSHQASTAAPGEMEGADRPFWPYSRAAELRQGRRGRLEPLVRRGGEDTGAGAEPGDR